jgi:predicted RNA binding protein YcfA (HicA-like mRNA interferase family)
MSPRAPRVTGKEIEKALERDGWQKVSQKGSHAQFEHPTKPGLVTIPLHSGEVIFAGTLKNILRQAGLTTEEFRRLLK